MPVFLEKVVLPFLGACIAALLITNPMGFDKTQRISLALAAICFAYFVAYTLHLLGSKKQMTPASPTPPVQEPTRSATPTPKSTRGNRRRNTEPGESHSTKPEPQPQQAHVRMSEGTQITSLDDRYPFAYRAVLQTEVAISPVAVIIACSDVPDMVTIVPNQGTEIAEMEGAFSDHATWRWAQWSQPAFDPENPITVTVYSKQKLITIRDFKVLNKIR